MWFKVDDKLHGHRKARKVRRSHSKKRRDVSPFGLWVTAGSWCGDSGTAGFVPLEVLEEWDDDAAELADRLVDAGLWRRTDRHGEEGYEFHDWRHYVPRPSGSEEDPGDAGRRGNHVRWHVNEGIVKEGCEFCDATAGRPPREPPDDPDTPPDRPDHRGDIGGDVGGNRIGYRKPAPSPTRPDPTAAAAASDAAAAAEATGAVENLPAPLAILRSRMQAHTRLAALRFDVMTPAQRTELERLVDLHGDQRLIDIALNTFRAKDPPIFVTAFIGTWSALPPPGAALAVVRPQQCPIHHTTLTPSGGCNACRADQIGAM